MSQTDETEIKIKGLCVTFPDKDGVEDIQALKDVNLDIKEGEFVSLLGPSGCGKTTLLRSIADLQEINSGIISVKGRTPKEIRKSQKYGIVFQSPVLYD
ncbi:MAG: ATP-binding cassette domain-containing protein [Spirochaetales bacterium]|nr:ATP-binding cassette domain-containing protein [Spirochaetales bacterium]